MVVLPLASPLCGVGRGALARHHGSAREFGIDAGSESHRSRGPAGGGPTPAGELGEWTGGRKMKPQPSPVSIVILTWNGLAYTKRCLDTLLSNTDHPAYHVIVVDNGSTDGTVEYLATQSSITSILNHSNLGFARANNIAIQAATPEHDIVLLNNDTEIYQPDWLVRMQETAHRAADIGVVGCRLVRPGGMLQHAGAYMPLETFWGQQIGGGEEDINPYNGDRDVESVVFAWLHLKRAVLDKVGLLDEG